jgi:thiol-disulfide isomerase/thioredoxin
VLTKQVWIFVVVVVAVVGYVFFQSSSGPSTTPATAQPGASPVDAPPPPSAVLAAGNKLPVVPLISLTGDRLELRPPTAGRPILLFIFSPTCSICHATLPTWKELYEAAQAAGIEVLSLSVLEPLRTAQYVDANQVPWNVYSLAGRDAIATLGVERVPTTLVLDGGGTISLALSGQLTPEQQAEILGALDIDVQG